MPNDTVATTARAAVDALRRYEDVAGRAAAAALRDGLAQMVRSTADRQHAERLISRLYPDDCQDSP